MTTAKKKTSAPSVKPADEWAGSVAEWQARTVHRAELPSGMRVEFRFLELGHLIASGALPEDLLELAMEEWGHIELHGKTGAGVDRIAHELKQLPDDAPAEQQDAAHERATKISMQIAALNRELVAAALIAPQVTADQLADPKFPLDDLAMLSRILARQIGTDARGRRIGVEPLDTFQVTAEEHGCAEDCAACEAARRRLSTVYVGDV